MDREAGGRYQRLLLSLPNAVLRKPSKRLLRLRTVSIGSLAATTPPQIPLWSSI
jgi:hypothetical protein